MTDEKRLLAAIIAAPDDDLVRCVYADWLEENAGTQPCPEVGCGNPAVGWNGFHKCRVCKGTGRVSEGKRERAEFIRVQCELAMFEREGLGSCEHTADHLKCMACCVDDSRRRERELLRPNVIPWTGLFLADPHYEPCWDDHAGEVVYGPLRVVFRRGFVDEIRLPLAAFLGGPCPGCNGYGVPEVITGHWQRCSRDMKCKGTDPGLAAELFRAHPIRVVRPTDKRPAQSRVDRWTWYGPHPTSPYEIQTDESRLPGYVWAELPHVDYISEQFALDTLSTVLVKIGRKRAGV